MVHRALNRAAVVLVVHLGVWIIGGLFGEVVGGLQGGRGIGVSHDTASLTRPALPASSRDSLHLLAQAAPLIVIMAYSCGPYG